MRAIISTHSSGGPCWRVSDVDEPELGSDDVLVRVAAAALNHADGLMRSGGYVPSDASWRVPADRVGFELAGTVAAVGPAVTGFVVGDQVMAQAGGACAEAVAVDAGLLLPTRGLAPTTAAALPSGLLTEHDALAQAGFVPGDDVLITGASSGVGRIGVQLARRLGAGRIVATCRRRAAADELARLGADLVVNPHAESIAEVLAGPGGAACSIVLDHVGGELLADVMRAVPAGARIIQIGRLGGPSAQLDLELLAARRLTLRGTTFRGRDLSELQHVNARLRDEPKLISAWGGILPTIDSVFALDAAEAAAERLVTGQHVGKIVLEI
jgi:NADPH:quinone reductase